MTVFKSAVGNTSNRPQDVFTPPKILEPVYEFFGGVDTDPCWHPDCLVEAKHTIQEAEDGCDHTKWRGNTFINPPYRDLKKWLEQVDQYEGEVIVLQPNRLHRGWQRRHVFGSIVLLLDYDIRFAGWKDTFPQSLLLTYRGYQTDRFAKCFGHLGNVVHIVPHES